MSATDFVPVIEMTPPSGMGSLKMRSLRGAAVLQPGLFPPLGWAGKAAVFAGLAMLMACVQRASAAVVSFEWQRTGAVGVADDGYAYPGSESVKYQTAASGVTAAFFGRNYGLVATASQPTDRWGLMTGTVPVPQSASGWLVSFGFQPDAVGSTTHSSGAGLTDASYLAIQLQPEPGTRVRATSLSLGLPRFLDLTDNAWVGVSADGFATAVPVDWSVTAGGTILEATLPDVYGALGQPVEVRLYGLLGADEGTFDFVRASAFTDGRITG